MIENGFVYISFLICFVAIVFFMVDKLKWKVFDIFSPMLIIYLGSAILGSLGLFPKTESVVVYQDIVTVNFLPLMLVFMLLQCDLRKILRMGPKMLLSFMCATFTICLGFVVAFLIFKNKLGSDAWSVLGAASGAWIGGSSNMMATANALGVSEEGLSYAILMGSISYTVLMSILMMTLQFVKKFNKWTNANTTYLD
ncbi:membrane protein [[Clostridium] sordellii]|nr:membrane protein [[Clostridium] sordellii] [Paeniclostridium sordellii]